MAAQAPTEHGDAAADVQGGQRVGGHGGVARLGVDALVLGGGVAGSAVAWVVEGDDAGYAWWWRAGEDVGEGEGAGGVSVEEEEGQVGWVRRCGGGVGLEDGCGDGAPGCWDCLGLGSGHCWSFFGLWGCVVGLEGWEMYPSRVWER